jgi:putative MFS transporter
MPIQSIGADAASRLERLPWCGYQRRIFLTIALAFFFDSVDLGTMTFVLGSLRAEFHLSNANTGLLASSSFLGMLLGASGAGLLADRFGRRPVFQWSMVTWGLASVLCSTAHSIATLIGYRILLGIGMGMEFPVAQTLLAELLPAHSRGRLIALLDGFWPLGFIAAGVTSYFILPRVGWRVQFAVLALPALFVLVLRRVVPESPRWLEYRGRLSECAVVLAKMESDVARSSGLASLPAPAPKPAAVRVTLEESTPLRQLWALGYRKRTSMLWLLWFFALLGFYGLTSWLGALLQQAGFQVTESVLYTVIISTGGIPGFISAAWLVERWGRKLACVAFLLGSAAMSFVYGQTALRAAGVAPLLASGFAMQFFFFGMWAVLYTYTPELYGTAVRATGSGFASAIGRLGSLLGPYAVGLTLPLFGHTGVFSLGALSFLIAAAAVWIMGIETKGLLLEDLAAVRDAG